MQEVIRREDVSSWSGGLGMLMTAVVQVCLTLSVSSNQLISDILFQSRHHCLANCQVKYFGPHLCN